MEKIKNLLNPGAKQDDEVLYGSGQSSDPIHAGQGSHFGASRTADSSNPLSSGQSSSTTGTSALGGNPSSTGHSVGNEGLTGHRGVGSSDPYDSGRSDSRMPGAFDDGSSTAEIRSGVPGRNVGDSSGLTGSSSLNKPLPNEPGTSSLGSGTTTTAGPHSSNLENKLDPRVDSDLDGSRGLGSRTGTTGSGLTGSSYPDRSLGNSGHENTGRTGNTGSSLGRDAAIGSAGLGAAEAAHHHHDKREGLGHDNLGSNTNRSFPLSGNSNTSSTDTTGNIGRGSNYSGSDIKPTHGSSHLGRDAGVAGAVLGQTGLGEHERHRERGVHDPISGSGLGSHPTGTTGYGSNTTGNTGYGSDNMRNSAEPTTGSSHLGRDAGLAGTALGGSGLAGHDRHRDRGINEPTSGIGAGSQISGTPGYGSDTTSHTNHPTTGSSHIGRDTGLAGAALGGAGLAQHEHGTHGHNFTGDPCGPEAAASGPHFVEGPHATDTANRLDPHVSATEIGTGLGTSAGHHGHGHHGHGHHGQSTTSPGVGSTEPAYGEQRGERHLGRDAAIGGAGAYEAGRHHQGTSASVDDSQSTTGPAHKSSLLNKLDPRVKQHDTDITEGTHGTSGTITTGRENESLTGAPSQHHYGRDAAIGTGIAGAGYEAEKHHHNKEPTSGDTSKHHLGRDTAAGTGIAGAAHDSEKHHHNKEPLSGAGNTSQHHYGRDAAIGAGVAGAGYEAEKHHRNNEDFTSGLSGTTAAGDPNQYRGATDYSSHPSSARDNSQTASTHHVGRDATIGAGVLGGGAAAGSEFSKKDAEREQKEFAKEEAKHEKALEKDHKHHEKELEKERKHHEKDLVKEEKKEEKHHEKDLKKEEKHEGKKHGGLLGLFHREKPDKDLKEEQAERTGSSGHKPAEAGLAAGAVGAAGLTEHERHEHERNRLHKDPPASVLNARNTGYANEPQSGYASQVTGGTGTTALAQGDSAQRGSHFSEIGNKLDPAVPDRGDTIGSHNRSTDPTTGLPIDYSKGEGRYGTDDTPTPGQHTAAGYGTGASGATGTSGHHGLHGSHHGEVNSSFPGAPGTHDGYEPDAGNVGSGTARYQS